MSHETNVYSRWFAESRERLETLFAHDLPLVDTETLMSGIADELPSCKAKTKDKFVAWCRNVAADVAARAVMEDQQHGWRKLKLEDVILLAEAKTTTDKVFEFEKRHKTALIRVGKHVWTLPIQYIELARALW